MTRTHKGCGYSTLSDLRTVFRGPIAGNALQLQTVCVKFGCICKNYVLKP